MSRMDSRPMCSEDIRGPPTTAASEDRRGGEGFLDEVGLELDKWHVEKQEGKHATWEEKHGHWNWFFLGEKTSYTMKGLSSLKEVTEKTERHTKKLKNWKRHK